MRLIFPTQLKAEVRSKLKFTKLGMFAFFISLSNNVMATTHFSPDSCNTEFKGVVKEVANSRAPFSSLPKIDITFNVTDKIKGEPGREYTVSLLKGAPQQFKVGETYQVFGHDRLLCVAHKIN